MLGSEVSFTIAPSLLHVFQEQAVGGARGGNVPDVVRKEAVGGVETLSSGSVVEGRANLRVPDQLTYHRVTSNKSKRTLVATELGQLNDVLATPSFQQDPFAAVQVMIVHLKPVE